MARTIGIGVQNFAELRENNYFYIDKTLFIKEWWEGGDSATLITRPRRFGKTMNMSMIEQFFSVEYAGRGDLFEGLAIWEEEKYRNLQGTYPVISLSFANVKQTCIEETKQKINQQLADLYERNRFLLEGGLLSENEKAYYNSIDVKMEDVVATSAINKMTEFLSRYYGKKVILLLDEYDTPMQEAYVHGYWNELVNFTRSMFNSAFKTNPYMARAIMTGITRVSKESMFSDLNHLEVVTITSDKYATAFGFTEEEVFTALDEFSLGVNQKDVKFWYDGFTFGKYTDIYNPWSILNFLDKKKLASYWVNTSSNGLVSKLIREGTRKVKNTFEKLLRGENIQCPIDEQIVYNQLDSSEASVWSLLLASGYLKVIDYERMEDLGDIPREPLYTLAVTNYEVQRMFYVLVRDWFNKTEADYNDFVQALLQEDLQGMNVYMNLVSKEIFSYFDVGRAPSDLQPERFYHGFVLGLIVELAGRYVITSNRESGYGRYDVMLEPLNKEDAAFILEFKVHDSEREGSLKDTVAAALQQIEKKQYAAQLVARGIEPERIQTYGFAFEGKKVLIG